MKLAPFWGISSNIAYIWQFFGWFSSLSYLNQFYQEIFNIECTYHLIFFKLSIKLYCMPILKMKYYSLLSSVLYIFFICEKINTQLIRFGRVSNNWLNWMKKKIYQIVWITLQYDQLLEKNLNLKKNFIFYYKIISFKLHNNLECRKFDLIYIYPAINYKLIFKLNKCCNWNRPMKFSGNLAKCCVSILINILFCKYHFTNVTEYKLHKTKCNQLENQIERFLLQM